MKKVLLISFCILFFWALFVPSLEYPDEQAHFASISYLFQTGSMPKDDQVDVSFELSKLETVLGTNRDTRGNNRFTYHPEIKHVFSPNIYGPAEQDVIDANTPSNRSNFLFKEGARYPYLFYGYSQVFYAGVSDSSIFDRLFAVRLGVVLIGVCNVFVAYKIGREFLDANQSRYLAYLVALQPMMTFVMSGVNSDSLHNLLFSLIILFCLRIIKYKHAGDSLFYLLVFFILDVLTKPQAFIALPIILVAFILRVIWHREYLSTLKYLLLLCLGGIIYLAITKNQDFLALVTDGKLPFVGDQLHPDAPQFFDYVRYSLDRFLHQNIVWFWGVFKWLGVVLPKAFWWLTNRLVLISGIGLLWGLLKSYTNEQRLKIIFLLSSVVIYIGAIFWFDWMYVRANAIQVAVQARYYFPIFSSLMTLLYLGILGFSTNEKYRLWGSRLLVGFFVLIQLGGIYTIAKSYYDLSSFTNLFVQASQYKPIYAKGVMWGIWSLIYLFSIASVIKNVFISTDLPEESLS